MTSQVLYMDFSFAERSAQAKDGRGGRLRMNSFRVFTVSVLMLFVVGCSGGEPKISSLDESTDVLALKGDGKVTFMNPVYWLPSSVSVSNETGTPLEFSCHG